MTWHGDDLRSAFTRFFVDRGHAALPPAGLIPHDPSVMFTIAGMVQFKPYFTGQQPPPVPRATTIQPCFRMVDIDIIGTTARHNTFFEMLGNFSFGDYFKELAIPYAWELVTEVLGIDPDRLWVTVHESDTDATGIWQDVAHLPVERIQRMGEDNFWKMGDTGPCGPSSEIYFDKGERFGEEGGPAHGSASRYIEIWNLVFMQYERSVDGALAELPKKNIDTGAGLERILALLQGVDSVFDTDVVAPVVEEAARLSGRAPGRSEESDVALRILADHARAMTFLVSDGVFPSNEGRGYVLRRVIRRAVLRAHQLGVAELVTPSLVDTVVATMSNAYPKLVRDASLVTKIVGHEEEAFRRTLRAGTALLDEELARGADRLPGDVAFRLHDTYGFPVDLTVEIAEQRGVEVDREGFDAAMDEQRRRARQAGKAGAGPDELGQERWRSVLEQFGPTEFVGYREPEAMARVLAVSPRDDAAGFVNVDGEQPPPGAELLDVVLDLTPFYAEGGGQVGDTGTLVSSTGTIRVLATDRAIEGITRHVGYVVEGEVPEGSVVTAAIDAPAARGDPAQSHRDPPAPLGAAPGPRRAREAAGLPRRARPPALRLQPFRSHHARGARARRGPRERGDPLRRARARLRDLEERGRGGGRDRLLRREVRRRRARRRGRRWVRGTVRRHARPLARAHRPVPDHLGELHRREHPADRGDHRRPDAAGDAASRRRRGPGRGVAADHAGGAAGGGRADRRAPARARRRAEAAARRTASDRGRRARPASTGRPGRGATRRARPERAA